MDLIVGLFSFCVLSPRSFCFFVKIPFYYSSYGVFASASMEWEHKLCTGALPPVDNVNRFTCAFDKDKKVLYHLDAGLSAQGHVQRVTLHTLDLASFTWTSVATTGGALPLTLSECAIALCNNRIYVFGGMELAGTYHNSMKYLDLSTSADCVFEVSLISFYRVANNTWTAGATYECPLARANTAFHSIGNHMFIWGGRTYNTANPYPAPALFVYDSVTNRWRDTRVKSPPNVGREGASMTSCGECLVLFGGHNSRSLSGDNLYLNDALIVFSGGARASDTTFNPQFLSFPVRNPSHSPKRRQGCSSVCVDGLVYIFGGETGRNQWINDLAVFRVVKGASTVGSVDALVSARVDAPTDSSSSSSSSGLGSATTLVEDDELSAEAKALDAEVSALPDLKARLSWAVNNRKTYPDVEFQLKSGKTVCAHKVILAARSIVFRRKYDPAAASKVRRDEDNGEVTQSHLDVSAESAIGSPGRNPASRKSPKPLRSPSSGRSHARSSSSSDDSGENLGKTHKKVSDVDLDTEKKTQSSPNLNAGALSGVDTIKLSDDFEEADLLDVLRYLYTGNVKIENEAHAERLSAIAYEYLLDDLMRQCRSKTFPVTITEPENSVSRFIRRMVGSTVGSDIFFVVKRKKLLSHRVILFLFSSTFRRQLLHIPTRRYIEIRDSGGATIEVDTFVEFCRTMYCFFTALPEHKEKHIDVASLLGIALSLRETKLVDLLAKQQVVTNETVMATFAVAKAHGLVALQKSCYTYLLENFSSIVKDKSIIDSWSEEFKKEVLQLYRETCPSWLDLLWFAHQTGDAALRGDAVQHLTDLINVENVISILVGAHNCSAKTLRSKCVDFILGQAGNVQAVQRMQNFSDTNLSQVSSLSTSLNAEMHQKVTSQVTAAGAGLAKSKLCTICFKEFSFFTNKKNSCTLCKRAACKDCIIQNFTIPPVFGYTKPKSICKNCHQMVGLFQ